MTLKEKNGGQCLDNTKANIFTLLHLHLCVVAGGFSNAVQRLLRRPLGQRGKRKTHRTNASTHNSFIPAAPCQSNSILSPPFIISQDSVLRDAHDTPTIPNRSPPSQRHQIWQVTSPKECSGHLVPASSPPHFSWPPSKTTAVPTAVAQPVVLEVLPPSLNKSPRRLHSSSSSSR